MSLAPIHTVIKIKDLTNVSSTLERGVANQVRVPPCIAIIGEASPENVSLKLEGGVANQVQVTPGRKSNGHKKTKKQKKNQVVVKKKTALRAAEKGNITGRKKQNREQRTPWLLLVSYMGPFNPFYLFHWATHCTFFR